MLKNLSYDGTYRDENISVSIMLENPLDWGIEVTAFVFSIALRSKNDNPIPARMSDFTFYIMDENNHLYNTQIILSPKFPQAIQEDDESIRQPDGLIQTDFKYEFLFQDLRIAFYDRPYEKMNIIKLQR